MSAYRGGCTGPKAFHIISCVCNCHVDQGECDSPETCGPIGMKPVKAQASDHVTVRHAKPRKVAIPRSRRTQRRIARAS